MWSIFLLLCLQLNSFTNASFNDIENVTAAFSVCHDFDGTDDECNELPDQWDKSSLEVDKKNPNYFCTQEGTKLTMYYSNKGEDMTFSKWEWQLYKVESSGGGQKMKPIGDAIDGGFLPNIMKNQSGELSTIIKQLDKGYYAFKVLRPSGHGNGNSGGNNKEDGRSFMWTEKVEVKKLCSESSKTESAEPIEQPKEEIKTESENAPTDSQEELSTDNNPSEIENSSTEEETEVDSNVNNKTETPSEEEEVKNTEQQDKQEEKDESTEETTTENKDEE